MRTWQATDPKAALMERKREQITAAARVAFLNEGFMGSSVNRIAADAGVSIKTLYRHFDDKDDLFAAVMQRACTVDSRVDQPWFGSPPERGLVEAGVALLEAVLSADQIALYRVVLVEGPRVPAVARSYREAFLDRRFGMLTEYFGLWPDQLLSRMSDPAAAAAVFNALAVTDVVEQVLLGAAPPDAAEIRDRANVAATRFLALVAADSL